MADKVNEKELNEVSGGGLYLAQEAEGQLNRVPQVDEALLNRVLLVEELPAAIKEEYAMAKDDLEREKILKKYGLTIKAKAPAKFIK